MDSETRARRRAGRKLRHRAAQLRKVATELEAVAAEIETGQLYQSSSATGGEAKPEDAADG